MDDENSIEEKGRNCFLSELKFLYPIKIKLALIQTRLLWVKTLIAVPRAITKKNNLKYIIKEGTQKMVKGKYLFNTKQFINGEMEDY